jgi:hypothetical protein
MPTDHDGAEQALTDADAAAAWPPRMRTEQSAIYLAQAHGLPVEEKTLRNWRAAGRGPACRYLGALPLYDKSELDRWAEHDALKTESPMRRNRRAARGGGGGGTGEVARSVAA